MVVATESPIVSLSASNRFTRYILTLNYPVAGSMTRGLRIDHATCIDYSG